jgi:hypothetical protein
MEEAGCSVTTKDDGDLGSGHAATKNYLKMGPHGTAAPPADIQLTIMTGARRVATVEIHDDDAGPRIRQFLVQ